MATETKYAPSDWHTSNSVIRSTAERQRSTTHDVRNLSYRARNETDLNTRWTQYKTDCKLSNRLSNVFDWKDALARTLADTEQEINALMTVKRMAEYALEAKNLPFEVVLNCLQTRQNRIGIDSVRDNVESELHKEVEVISGIRVLLQQRIGEAFNQLSVLQLCYRQLSEDLTDKHHAISIDSDCAGLTNRTKTVSMHRDPTRIEKGIVTPQQWEAYSNHNVLQAEHEMSLSVRLRETINQAIQQTTNDIESQWVATNTALRKRIHELNQTKKELEWQKKNTIEEIDKVTKEINALEEALADKVPPMMVAQTRLENRTHRPNVELCRDNPQYHLVEEVGEITTSQKILRDKLRLAKLGLGTLQRTLSRICNDLGIKTNSLNLDQECLVFREKLSEHPKPSKIAEMVKKEQNEP